MDQPALGPQRRPPQPPTLCTKAVGYSDRSAVIGLIAAARRAGTTRAKAPAVGRPGHAIVVMTGVHVTCGDNRVQLPTATIWLPGVRQCAGIQFQTSPSISPTIVLSEPR
jgi:hypothetical protein